MRDLELWRKLTSRPIDEQELLPRLLELAKCDLPFRVPFFGPVSELLESDDPEWKQAALACLAGAGGSLAFRALVRSLGDSDREVRTAALDALRKSAGQDPPRWAHALFHHDPEIRRAALAGGPVKEVEWYALYLLADPECEDLAADGLLKQAGSVPGMTLPALTEMAGRGKLDASLARRLIVHIEPGDRMAWMFSAFRRSPEEVQDLLDRAGNASADGILSETKTSDAWDQLLDLFWEPDVLPVEKGTASPAEQFFTDLIDALNHDGSGERLRVAVSLMVVASRRGTWFGPALEACLAFVPNTIGFGWISASERRKAIRVFYRLGGQCRREPAANIKPLIEHFHSPARGSVDLWAVGGILHLLENHPYKLLQEWVPLGRIVSSFWADPKSSVPFLCLRDNSETGREFLLFEIMKHHRPEQPALFAWMIHSIPADGYEFLDGLSGLEAAGALSALLEMEELEGKTLSENKTRVASQWLARRILSGGLPAVLEFLNAWLKAKEPERYQLGLAILGLIADDLSIEALKDIFAAFRDARLRTIVKLIGWCPGFPYGKERQLAEMCLAHSDWEIRRWALRCCPEDAGESLPPALPRIVPRTGYQLTDAEIEHIATCGESALPNALKPALESPSRGLCAALAKRPDPTASQVEACAALLASHDSLRLIREQFERFADTSSKDFIERLESTMVVTWNRRQELPMIGHAWLHRWECHAFAFAELAERHSAGWEGQMRYAMNAASPFLRIRIWQAMARVVALLRYRDKPRLHERWTAGFAELAVDCLGTPWGPPAAILLIHALYAKVAPESFEQLKSAVISRLPEMSEAGRETLRPWVSSLGVAHLPVESRPVKGLADEQILAKIASSSDLDRLEQWCFDQNAKIAEEAALRLLEFAEPGAQRLLAILSGEPLPPSALLLAETLSLWPDGPALKTAAELIADGTRPLPLRFLIGLQLLERGQREWVDRVLDLVNADTPTAWFQQSDWNRLLAAGLTKTRLSVALSASPHPQAYMPALRWLLAVQQAGEEDIAAVGRFLEAGSERLFELRVQAAAWLLERGDLRGFPILLQYAAQNASGTNPFVGAIPVNVIAAVSSALIAGGNLFSEERLFELLKDGVKDPALLQDAFEPMLAQCLSDSVRQAIIPRVRKTASRSMKLRRVAEEFAWGIRLGRELTGRLFAIDMIGGEDLGYTRLEENKIHITPQPILRGERNARDVVRGLILHEFGHHMYHRGAIEQEIWEEAHNQGLGRLLNLVSDEHLERNLRALEESFGDRLKKLAAYAFQHSKKEMPVADLLTALSGRAFEVLVGTKLQVARRRGSAVVDNGQILLEMERSGLSFARFVRALRMGLGNRHDDLKVQAGLDLFRGKFRKSSMADMLEISKKLREIFGWECSLLDSFSQDECLRGEPSDLEALGEGITNQEVQSEIQRINNPRKSAGKRGEGGGGTRWINVSEEEQFETITTVVPMAFDRNQYAPYAQRVARPARQLRQYLKDLGLAMVQHRMRVAGRLLDRTRIPAVVIRNDPRMLIARQRKTHNDLFLGALIDCSGSMDYSGNIEKAKMFGALLAEAVNGLEGVDLRLFGFTDAVIYDAGNEQRPAVHSLHAGGGNNDAAALWHAAQVAMASKRKAKVLVMISDGLPTECSALALKGLATRLTNRQKICCAQVAVQPLEEICFPHYILLEESDVETSVRRFGNTIARLVRRAMSGS